MSELLLEFFCEEIPARMQARAEADLERLMRARLEAAGLSFAQLETFSGPRRLGLVIEGLPGKTEDVREARKGPKVGAPDKAIEGFLRSAGLESLDQCTIEDGKKGQFYVARIEKPGREAVEVIAETVPAIAKDFPWPKSMKFAEGEKTQRWVRPLQRVLCLLGGAVVPLEVFGIPASNETEGHRIHGRGPFAVKGFTDYEATLAKNGVILKRAERRQAVLDGARKICAEAGFELVEDQGLLEEVTGLVEHPTAVLGDMDPDFLDLPPEVITLTMKVHQRYFAVRDPKTGALAAKFVMLANQDAPDGGKAIALGAARVLSARLSDARHFWDADLKTGLDAMAAELSKVTFHDQLGTVADKVERIAALARELAPAVGADPDLAERAARLAKADLVCQMVYEFPELQGAMGRYYALAPAPSVPDQVRDTSPASRGGQDAGAMSPPAGGGSAPDDDPRRGGLLDGLSRGQIEQIADAIRDHYKPQGPSDAVPTAPVSAAVALADKLDTLVGFWAIDEKPTGSKDPFALRRAALGVIRVLEDGKLHLALGHALSKAHFGLEAHHHDAGSGGRSFKQYGADLLAFFADRLKVHLKDEGVKHDVIDAVFAPRLDGSVDDDLVRVTHKVRALQAFIDTEDGAALLAGYRRAANILKAEEKKGFALAAARGEALGHPAHETPDAQRSGASGSSGARASKTVPDHAFGASGNSELVGVIAASASEPEERALITALQTAGDDASAALEREDFKAAMSALAALRAPVDAFFESVTVNADDEVLRRNRLLLLSEIRSAVHTVADFGRLEG